VVPIGRPGQEVKTVFKICSNLTDEVVPGPLMISECDEVAAIFAVNTTMYVHMENTCLSAVASRSINWEKLSRTIWPWSVTEVMFCACRFRKSFPFCRASATSVPTEHVVGFCKIGRVVA
jgi:hypothetical protein